ncbi:MAG: hypothetical protein ACRDZO_13720 [Egibacteraceae bacterium]
MIGGAEAEVVVEVVVQNLILASAATTGLVTWGLAGHLPLPLGSAAPPGTLPLSPIERSRLPVAADSRRSRGVRT